MAGGSGGIGNGNGVANGKRPLVSSQCLVKSLMCNSNEREGYSGGNVVSAMWRSVCMALLPVSALMRVNCRVFIFSNNCSQKWRVYLSQPHRNMWQQRNDVTRTEGYSAVMCIMCLIVCNVYRGGSVAA